jgi:outer membrane protein OmpA-like peptidoglycan-associated protein
VTDSEGSGPEDWAIDVRTYVANPNEAAIAGIVRYCGIALRTRDASLVAFSDSVETDRVRENFLKKKLGLTEPDSVLDAAIAAVGARMSADRTKNRVTVYYLLAEAYGKLDMFVSAKAAAASAAPAPLFAAAAPVAAPAAAPVARASSRGLWVPLLLAVVGGLGVYAVIARGGAEPVVAPAPVVEAAVVPEAPAVPEGAGVVSSMVDEKPVVSVYFDTSSTELSPDVVPALVVIKTWLVAHPTGKAVVMGYADPRGSAELNAELSKNRAFAVREALVADGIAEEAIEMRKPSDVTDETTSLANGRRVDILAE